MTAVPNYAGKWVDLNPKLSPSTLEAIAHLGFDKLTPVQAAAIPLFMQNKDVVVEAVTGSGKTLAFLVPVIEKLKRLSSPLEGKKVGAIIISPTRELARQIFQVCTSLIEYENTTNPLLSTQLHPMLLTGGGGASVLEKDVHTILSNPPRILIGTPGRLEEVLVNRPGLIDTKDLEMLVLDEADRLLELGFSNVINKIIAAVPKQRRTGLFSATMTDDLSELVRAGLRNPVKVVVKVSKASGSETSGSTSNQSLKEQRIPDSLTVEYIVCRPWQKLAQILRYINSRSPDGKYVVYFSTCAVVDYFYKIFKLVSGLENFDVLSLHGQMDLKHRTSTLQKFTSLGLVGRGAILLTTDVSSRGLDIPDVDGVIQFDLPTDPKAFAHRCGRTARAGRLGRALFFLSPGREELYPDFLQVRKVPTSRVDFLPPQGSSASAGPQASDESTSEPLIIESEDPEALSQLRTLRVKIAEDRVLTEKGVKAFVSFIRAYSKHQASYIFRIAELDFAGHGWAYLLLRLPKMPELKNRKVAYEDFVVKIQDIPYSNKIQEASRQSKIKEKADLNSQKANLAVKPRVPKNQAWSKKIAAKERKEKRQQSKLIKATAQHASGTHPSHSEQPSSLLNLIKSKNKKDAQDDSSDDWDDLDRDTRLIKKMRKGKLSKDAGDLELYSEL